MTQKHTAFFAVASACIGAVAATLALPRIAESRQSQAEMNQEAARDYAKADAELNRVYKKLLPKLDATGQAKLKKAQRAWITYRDADASFASDTARGGSMSPMLYSGAAAALTKERTERLTQYLDDYNSR